MNKARIAFFADPHIRSNKIQSQTDFGAPSRWIPRQAQRALNSINPDLIFGLGDLTAGGSKKDWLGYQKWLQGIKAPVVDLLGNHDRDYTIFHKYNYAQEYFTLLNRTSATKVVKIGNLVFILISEEHNPEGSDNILTSTVPDKTFSFIEDILQKYEESHNIFVLNHTLPRGTTALSNDWSFNDIKAWKIISKKFFKLFEQYKVVAHLTGHAHIDYRYRAKLKDIGGVRHKRKVGKFINGFDYPTLPNTYFLNMACVDTAHGWLGSNFTLLRTLGKATSKAQRSPLRQFYIKLEEKGLPFFDLLYMSKIHYILGRPAVYYFDAAAGKNNVQVMTRWLGKNKDTEQYHLNLQQPIHLGKSKAKIIAADLSLQTKQNLHIVRDDWFTIPANEKGVGFFSQHLSKKRRINDAVVIAQNLKNYTVFWQGSHNKGQNWSGSWVKNPAKLGVVNAVKLKVYFTAGSGTARVKNILVK